MVVKWTMPHVCSIVIDTLHFTNPGARFGRRGLTPRYLTLYLLHLYRKPKYLDITISTMDRLPDEVILSILSCMHS
jgi:hypothetical protein